MRMELLYNPRLLCERLAAESMRRRRLKKLKGTPAENLKTSHVDSLELLELAGELGIEVIYDVGANVGTWTLLAKAIFPNSELHAFEPLTQHLQSFEVACRGLSRVALHPIALGSETSLRRMNIATFSDASSLLELGPGMREDFSVTKAGEEEVRVERLDSHVQWKQMRLPDLIKLDVQGYELEVLNGALECLSHAKAIITEVSFVEFYTGQCFFEEIMSILGLYGFRLHAFGVNTGLGKAIAQTDVLFVKRR